MPTRLDWQVGRGEVEAAVADLIAADPAATPTPSPVSKSGSRRGTWITVYVLALLGAGWIGFNIGRWQEMRAANTANLANQLAIESLAWHDRDANLFDSTLDPDAPETWRTTLQGLYAASPTLDYQARLTRVDLVRPDLAKATVEVVEDGATRVEDRLYRLLRGSWYRTPGP